MNKQTFSSGKILLCCAIFLPHFLKDFFDLYITDYAIWTLLDWSMRIIVLFLILLVSNKKSIKLNDLYVINIGFARTAIYSSILSIVSIFISIFQLYIQLRFPQYAFAATRPFNKNSILFPIDLHLGLLLVAIEEEVVGRGVMLFLLKKMTNNFYIMITISSLLFGAAHWSLGIYSVIFNSLIGAIYFIAVWRTGSIVPSVIAHFVCNYFIYILRAAG